MGRGLTCLLCLLFSLSLLLLLRWYKQGEFFASEKAVQAPAEVHSFLGETVTLPCNLHSRESSNLTVTQITWKRLEPSREPKTTAVLHPLYGPLIPESNRMAFTAAQWGGDLLDASLMISRLQPEDDANYTCEITTLQKGSMSATTWLRVFYAPQVSISRSDAIRQQGPNETTLICDARSNPEPKSYDWSTQVLETTGSLPAFAVPQGPRLLIRLTEETINTTFICRVTNELGTGEAIMRVLFPAEPAREELASNLAKISLLVVGIMFFLVIFIIPAFVPEVQKNPECPPLWNILHSLTERENPRAMIAEYPLWTRLCEILKEASEI